MEFAEILILGKAQKEKLWEGIAFHILKDGVAFTTTEAIGFRTMLRRFLPGFEAPCAKTVKKTPLNLRGTQRFILPTIRSSKCVNNCLLEQRRK